MMNKYYLIFLISIIGLFFISGCQQQTLTCNEPYILVGNECCLDQNANGICDKDETMPEQNETPILEDSEIIETQTDKEKLEDVAKKFGRLLEVDEYKDMYDMLTPERQNYKSKEEFNQLCGLIHGRGSYRSVIFNKVEIEEENLGFAYYDLVWNSGYQEKSGAFYFKQIDNEWYFNGFSDVIYAGCYESSDCTKEPAVSILKDVCKKTCEERTKDNLFLIDPEKQFSCDNNVCQCVCWNEAQTQGQHVWPDWKFVH